MASNALKRLFLIRVLAMTSGGPVELEMLRGSLKVTSNAFNILLHRCVEEGLISLTGSTIQLTLEQRLDLSLRAVELGADFETISRELGWLEFEELSAKVFEANGFRVKRRFRFSAQGRRWELDILAVRSPYMICGECKHWGRGMGNSTARGIIETHLEKTSVFSKHLGELRGRIGVESWSKAIIVPMTLTLSATPMEIYRRVPSVSVLALPSFLSEFDGQLERLANFRVELPPMPPEPKQTILKKRRVNGFTRARR